MPIYEFRCNDCRRRISVFIRTVSAEVTASCDHCGSASLSRLFSRVAVHRADGGEGDVDENDPRSVAKWVRRMSHQMGEPLDKTMEADLERMEAGEMPDDYADEPEEDFAGV